MSLLPALSLDQRDSDVFSVPLGVRRQLPLNICQHGDPLSYRQSFPLKNDIRPLKAWSELDRFPWLIGRREHRVCQPLLKRRVLAELLEQLGMV